MPRGAAAAAAAGHRPVTSACLLLQLSAMLVATLGALLLASAAAAAAAEPIQCTAAAEKPQWPVYHFFNNITRGPACYCSPAPCSCKGGAHPGGNDLVMEPLNDANTIFEFKGLFHVMMQAGGGNWTHGVAHTAAGPWFTEIDALNRATNASLPWDSHQGPCDGSASFPDLGKAPYDGSTPVIMYGPDCNQKLGPPGPPGQQQLGAGLGDAPRVEVALPADPTDPMLRDWVKQTPGPVVFDGVPCSFPGHVWKSTTAPNTWNMICALDGKSPWVRFSSTTPTLMRWKLADQNFLVSAEACARGMCTAASGAYFQAIPNPKAGGPTHMINTGSAGPMLLGVFDNKTEKLTINNTLGQQVLDSSSGFRWGAVGSASDGRLLMVAWVQESGQCGDGQPVGFGACARSVTSLTRELVFDHATDQVSNASFPLIFVMKNNGFIPRQARDKSTRKTHKKARFVSFFQLISRPVADYDSLHNATFVDGERMTLAPGSSKTLPVPSAAGGALE